MKDTFGRKWEKIRSIGEGGQGRTFLVRDTTNEDSESNYVLKVLKNISRKARFESEINNTLSLSHPSIVKIVDHDLDTDKPYLVMEYCTGGTLATCKPFWHQNPVDALVLFEQILDGIIYAHSKGVIHRDLKPENILLRQSDGPPVIGDFGLSIIEDSQYRVTETDEAVGPRLYMAPEFEDGRNNSVSNRADIYSLGKLLYWLITGKIFSREKYRHPDWDIKRIIRHSSTVLLENSFLEHINTLFDLMIVENPEKRRSAENIQILTRQTRFLLQHGFHSLSLSMDQLCSFCGKGTYSVLVTEHKDPNQANNPAIKNLGIEPRGLSRWRILTCKNCGHMQFFQIDSGINEPW